MNPKMTPADAPATLPDGPDSEDAEFELQEAAVPLSLAGKRFVDGRCVGTSPNPDSSAQCRKISMRNPYLLPSDIFAP